MTQVIYDIECDEEKMEEINEFSLNFQHDYEVLGNTLGAHVLSINFPGTSDWCFAIIVPYNELSTCKDTLDMYPIYFIEFDCATVKREANNFKQFLSKWWGLDDRLNVLSNGKKLQRNPKFRQLEPKELSHIRENPPAPIDIETL